MSNNRNSDIISIPTTSNRVVYDFDTSSISSDVSWMKLKVESHKTKNCSDDGWSQWSNQYKLVNSWEIMYNPDPLTETVGMIGGESQYCNVDGNGNYRLAYRDNLFLRVAYSQVGYKEKKSNSNLNSCTANAGNKGYQKYSTTTGEWSNYFVIWCMKKAGIYRPFGDNATVKDMINWAKQNGRWKVWKNGSIGELVDLYVYANGTKVGISAGTMGNYIIHGDSKNSMVSETDWADDQFLDAPSGVINMKGITY